MGKSAKQLAMEAQARCDLREERKEAKQAVRQASHVVKTTGTALKAAEKKAGDITLTATHCFRTPTGHLEPPSPPKGPPSSPRIHG